MASDEQQVIEEAAHWLALLQSGVISPQERAAFYCWRMADPRREQVFLRMRTGAERLARDELRSMPTERLLQTLMAASKRRNTLLNLLTWIGLSSWAGLLMCLVGSDVR